MGRWAASTVLEYIEEAMAEVTACWAKWPLGCFTGNFEASSAFSPKLSERVDRVEQIILDTRAKLEQSESRCCQLAQKQTEIEDHVQGQQWVWKTNDKCEVRTVLLVVEESLRVCQRCMRMELCT